MAINALIAQGIRPIGADLPEVGNMLQQMQQRRVQNALAQQGMEIDAANATTSQMNAMANLSRQRADMDEATRGQVANALDNLQTITDPQQYSQAIEAYVQHPLAQQFRVTREELTPQGLPQLRARLGLGAPKPKDAEPLETVDVNGVPTLVPRSQASGKRAYYKPSSNGLRIESDGAGGFSLYQGDGASAISLGKPAQAALQTQAIDSRTALDRLGQIRAGFNPKWLTLKEQATQYMRGMQSRAQGLPFVPKLSEQDTADLSAFTTFKSDTLDNLNRTIKELTGAAMGVQEAERIIGSLPNLDDDPVAFKAKYEAAEQRLRMVLARSIYTQKQGIKFDAVPVDKMRILINKRGDELYKKLKDPEAVKQALESEFFQ